MRFEWDPEKNKSNLRKHKVSFETAARVFLDPLCFVRHDRTVGGEERWQAMGYIDDVLLLLVVHTVKEEAEEEVVRIISARRPTVRERRDYEDEQ